MRVPMHTLQHTRNNGSDCLHGCRTRNRKGTKKEKIDERTDDISGSRRLGTCLTFQQESTSLDQNSSPVIPDDLTPQDADLSHWDPMLQGDDLKRELHCRVGHLRFRRCDAVPDEQTRDRPVVVTVERIAVAVFIPEEGESHLICVGVDTNITAQVSFAGQTQTDE